MFDQYIGIDYSGAETPLASLKGLRVYVAGRNSPPSEAPPPPSPRRYWSRREVAEWLVERLTEGRPALVGIDHGFSFPLAYFNKYDLPHNWPAFLDDFQRHWPTDGDYIYVESIREGVHGNGMARTGNTRWRRLTELRARAKSVFHFDVPGQVAKSTHAGLPWLRYIRQRAPKTHFWPFDGWEIPLGLSVVAEVYPTLWSREFSKENRNNDQHDAFSAAAWMRRADLDGTLRDHFVPALSPGEQAIGQIEGWILGVR